MNANEAQSLDREPLYNIRLIRGYLEYIERNYPEVDIQAILDYAGISSYELNDPGFWFSQEQADLFYACVLQKTANPKIARESGRVGATATAYTAFRQYALGFISPALAYGMITRLAMTLTRGGTLETRHVSANQVEIVARPKPGVVEKAYQCENRLGILEALALPFTGKLAEIRHDECLHAGGECCRYQVSWQEASFYHWIKARNALLSLVLVGGLPLWTLWPELLKLWFGWGGFAVLILSLLAANLEKRELVRNLETQGNAAEQLFSATNNRFNDALLIKEIGQAISSQLSAESLFDGVMQVLARRSGFDRGLVLLGDEAGTRLCFGACYGYSAELVERLKTMELDLISEAYNGPCVGVFHAQAPVMINDLGAHLVDYTPATQELFAILASLSLVCVPISHNGLALGVLYMDNFATKPPLGQSQISLLSGVGQQIGVSLMNVRSFEALQRSETKYRELVENANSLIMRIDRQGRLVFFNEYAQRFFGYSARRVLDRELIGSVIPDGTSVARAFRQVIEEGDAVTGLETEVKRADGSSAWLSWNIRPLNGSQVKEFLCVGSNITQQKQLEARLRQRQKTEAIGTLASGIAHDFNNILFPILGYAEMSLDDVAEDSLVHANLEQIAKAARRAKELVEQILLFSRKGEHELRALMLKPVVKEALKLLRASLPSTIKIVQQLEGEVAPVDADPTMVHQIVMNLCANAAHAMKEGGELRVTLGQDVLSASKGSFAYACLKVADSGSGIRPEHLEKIFDPYFTTKPPGEGSGMGLSVVQGIVSRLGGRIEVSSNLGAGTEFRVYLPFSKNAVTERGGEAQTVVPHGTERILVVDDENFVAEMEQQMLERLGYQVTAFTDSRAALEHFKVAAGAYDLVVTDQTMPDLTGADLARQLLAIKPFIPIILCTGFSSEIDENSIKDLGVRELVMKPIETARLGQAIRRALEI